MKIFGKQKNMKTSSLLLIVSYLKKGRDEAGKPKEWTLRAFNSLQSAEKKKRFKWKYFPIVENEGI